LRFQIARAGSINIAIVLRTIELDHEPQRTAVEVDHIGRDWMLAAKLQAIQLACAKALPELSLGIGFGPAQRTRETETPGRQWWLVH